MDITKIQRILLKAVKDYGIVAKHDEEILVSFLSVDLFRSKLLGIDISKYYTIITGSIH